MAEFTGFPLVAVGVPGEVHLTKKNPVGLEQVMADGQKYVYLPGLLGIAAGDWVTYDEAGVPLELDTDVAASILGPVAIASGAFVAGTWGWYLRRGSMAANSGTVVDNAKVYATSTAGRCDDAPVAGAQVVGAVWRSADASNLATVQINDPWIGVTDAT